MHKNYLFKLISKREFTLITKHSSQTEIKISNQFHNMTILVAQQRSSQNSLAKLKYKYQPITRRQILNSSKLKDSADDNFKFDKNGRKLSKWVENTVGKGEIARYEQFLLFQQCFQKAYFPGASNGVIVWEWVKATCI